MRICLVARLPLGASGGVESYVVGLATGLSTLSAEGDEYLFLTSDDSAEWLQPYVAGPCRVVLEDSKRSVRGALRNVPGARRAWHAISPRLGPRSVLLERSTGTVERLGVDVVHFPTQDAFLSDLVSIYQPHDLQHLHLPEFFAAHEFLRRETTYRAFCTQAAMVAVSSTWVKDDLVRSYGLPERKICVVPLAPPIAAYREPSQADLDAVRARFDLPPRFLFYPAQTWPHKNHIRLLEALRRLYDNGLTVPVVFSGAQTEHSRHIFARRDQLGLEHLVSLVGYVDPTSLRSLYRLCSGVVIPTTFEAASFPLWEAFSSGVPAACSNVTSLPEQAADAAIIFDPYRTTDIADAVRLLWTDDSTCRELVRRGKERVARLSWERTARVFRAHYRRLLGVSLGVEEEELLREETEAFAGPQRKAGRSSNTMR